MMLLFTCMNFLFVFVTLVSSDFTCDECTAVVDASAKFFTSDESIEEQNVILLAKVCPQLPWAEDCMKELPINWPFAAKVVWPNYYKAEEEWMCAGLCHTR